MMTPARVYVTAGELARELGYTRNHLARLLDALMRDGRMIEIVVVGTRRLYR